MMGGDISKEEKQSSSNYLQDMNQRELTYGSDAGVNPKSVTYTQFPLHAHSIPVTSDNLVVDLNQLCTEQDVLPDLNTVDMNSFNDPGCNLDRLPLDAHKTVVSDSLMNEQINSLIDTKEIKSTFYEKPGADINAQKNHEGGAVESNWPIKIDGGFLSLGIGDSTEVTSECCRNWKCGTGELLNSFDVQKAIGGFSGTGHPFDKLSDNQNEVGVSTSSNDHARSVYGSYSHPCSSQFPKLQNTPDMLKEYPNLDNTKRIGGELAASSGQFGNESYSGLSEFENIFAYSLGLESVRPSLTCSQPNSNQLGMRHMQTVNSFSSESSTVSSATEVTGRSITQENIGQVSPFVSITAQAAKKSSHFLKRKLVQPDGSIYGVNAKFDTFGAKVGQISNSTGVQMSESSVLQPARGDLFPKIPGIQGKLIIHSKDGGSSQASSVLDGSSRKRTAHKSPPEAPKVQRKKITVPPSVIPPVAFVPNAAPALAPLGAPKVQRKKKIISPPILPNVAPNTPVAPRVQRKSKTVPSLIYLPLVAPPPASTVQITNVTSIPPSINPKPPVARTVQRKSKADISPVIPSIPYPPSVTPTLPPASTIQTIPSATRARGTKKTVPQSAIPAVAPKLQCKSKTVPVGLTLPVDPRVQLSNIKVSSPIITSIKNPPMSQRKAVKVPSHVIPSIENPLSAPFVAPTLPPPTGVPPTKMRIPHPVIRDVPNMPSVAAAPPVPDSPEHIKWQDPDEHPPPLGERCMICKRDLLFTAEGQVFQPAFPPSSAVLPCGHTFHDDCLSKITPEDQATNPPCIPCAVGEY